MSVWVAGGGAWGLRERAVPFSYDAPLADLVAAAPDRRAAEALVDCEFSFAIRQPDASVITLSTLALHVVSYATLALGHPIVHRDEFAALILTPYFMGWVSRASVTLVRLRNVTSLRLWRLNGSFCEAQMYVDRRTA